MSKNDAAPTIGWVIVSHINTFVVRLCLFLLACIVVAGLIIFIRFEADCYDRPRWTFGVAGYEVDVMFSKECSVK